VPIKKYCFLLFFLVTASTLPAQVLLDDTFGTADTSGDLAGVGPQGAQNPPASATWVLNSTDPNASAIYTSGYFNPDLGAFVPGSLAQTFATDQSVSAYFAGPGNQQVLSNVGDALTLDFAFTMNTVNASADGIRVALLNSGSINSDFNYQVSGANSDIASSTFANYTGVAAFFDPSNSKINLYTRDSGPGNTTLIAGATNAAYNLFAPAGPGGLGITAGTPYLGTLTLTYQGVSNMGVSFSIYDMTDPLNPALLAGEGSAAFDSPASFDTIVLGGLNGAGDMTLSEVSVVLVPEPPVYALCAGGLAVLASVGWWNRRHTAKAA
jgi:hypothetical protein